MITLTALVPGRDVDEADAGGEVILEDAPKITKWRLRDLPITEEALALPSYERNPEWLGEEIDPSQEPDRIVRNCGGCQRTFTSCWFFDGYSWVPMLFCDGCQKINAERHALTWERIKRGDPYAYVYSYGKARNFANVTGIRFILTDPSITSMTGVVPPVKSRKLFMNAVADLVSLPVTKPATGPTGHAEFGPSSMKYRELCPHWQNSPGTNDAAEEGTMLHERLVTGNYEGLDEQQRTSVELVGDLFDSIAGEMKNPQVFIEKRVDVAGLTWGTSDAIYVERPKAKVLDAKFGWIPVDDAEVNLQGWCYVVGVFHEFPDVQEVEAIFAQPRIDEVSRHTFTREKDYARMQLRIATVIERAKDPDAPYNPSPDTCLYCGNKAKCKALHAMALKVGPKVGGFEIPAELVPENITEPEQMALALLLAEVMGPWSEATKDRARTLMLDGGMDIPGWVLNQRSSPREITNVNAAWEIVQDRATPAEFMACIKGIRIGDLEKLYAAKAPRGMKGQAKQELDDKLRDKDAIRQEGVVHYLKRVSVPAALENKKP